MISIRKLADCLFLPSAFSIRKDLLGWLNPAPVLSLAKEAAQIHCYKLADVPDVDQRWSSLPKNGANFCVPAATMNWLYFMGVPADPHSDPATVLNLTQLGNQMDTDGDDGTGFSDGIEGLNAWLDDHQAVALVVGATLTEGASVRIEHLRDWAALGGLVNVNMGRYSKNDDELQRKTGHRMTMVGLHQSKGRCEIVVHNPDDDTSDLTTQSAREQKSALVNEHWNIEGEGTTLPRWGTSTDPFRFIDGYVVIAPLFALTNANESALTYYQAALKTGRIASRSFSLPFAGQLSGLAIHPRLPQAAVIAKGGVWTLNLASGTWRRIAALPAPTRLTYGGRAHRLFVVQERGLVSIDVETGALRRTELPTPIDAITYSEHGNLIVATSVEAQSIVSFTPNLDLHRRDELPDMPFRGPHFLSADPRDGTIFATNPRSSEVTTIDLTPAGAVVRTTTRLDGEPISFVTQVNRRGVFYATGNGKISAFDLAGHRVTAAVFAGLPAGSLLDVARSQHNFDPRRSSLRQWRDSLETHAAADRDS